MDIDKTEKSRNYPLVTLILSLGGMVVMSSLYATIPLIGVFSESFSVPMDQAVWAGSAFSFCFAAGGLIYGPVSERFGRKKVILLGLTALTLFSFLLTFVKTLAPLIALRALQGAAAVTFPPVTLSYVQDFFPQNKKVGVIGFISTGFLVAGIAGQLFSSLVNTYLGWNYVFLLLAVIYAITAVLIKLLIPATPAKHIAVLSSFKRMPKILGDKRFLSIYVVAFIILLSFVGMYTALGDYLANRYNFNAGQIFNVRLAGIIGMVLSPLAGKLVKKYKAVPILRGSLALSLLGLILLTVVTNEIAATISSVIFVCGIAITIPTIVSLTGMLGGATAISMYTFFLFLGATAGPVLAAGVLKTGNYTLTFLSLAGCVAVGMIATLFIKADS